jgi:predicted PurR-regulated permease PerM
LITSVVIIALVYAKPIMIPFVIALLIWFVVKKTRNMIDKIGFVNRFIPQWIKTLAASFVIFALLLSIGRMLTSNIEELSKSYATYASNIENIANQINEMFGINLNKEIPKWLEAIEFESYLDSFVKSISDVLGSMVMIVFYIVFIFFEESLFERKIGLIFTENSQHKGFTVSMKKIDKSLARYISMKSLINLLVATLSYFVLLSVGIDSPMFWAFLVFMFNFIPSIGPIMGTILPSLFALIQFGELTQFAIILIGLGTIATLVGSLVEPRIMGNTLNISPLFAILSLAVWGAIWGITGMLLSVPITVTMIIIFSQFQSTRNIAILLSEKGKV